MSQNRDIRHRLEMASEAIEALDAELAAGRLGVEEHGRRRAELEREAGRLFVSLRRSQRETGSALARNLRPVVASNTSIANEIPAAMKVSLAM